MPGALAQLGQIFTNPGGGANWGNILKGVLTGGGVLGDILNMRQQQKSLGQTLYYQRHPEAAAARIRSMTQPLSMGLTQDVGNEVQGYLGERGLSGSPNITGSVLAQALAPYYQQNQNTAANAFGELINPAGARFQNPIDMGSLLKLWQPAANVTVPGIPTDPGMSGPGGGGSAGFNWGNMGDYAPWIAPPTFDTSSSYNFGDLAPVGAS